MDRPSICLPLQPPIAPMLAQLARELPVGDYLYEPKWDGFRCIAFVAGARVELQSRTGRPLTRYFPEVIEAFAALGRAAVIDGEIIGRGVDFPTLMNRIHPAAARVATLRATAPAAFVAFDLLSLDGEDLREQPFAARRAALAQVLPAEGTLVLTPATDDPRAARDWLARRSGGIDGVVAKARTLPYRAGKRAMIKVKTEHTIDCVLAGFRANVPPKPGVASLLLGLYDGGVLRHVGVSSSFTAAARRELLRVLAPLVAPLAGHPWATGFGLERSPVGRLPGSAGRWDPTEMALDWTPVRPELVCEVAYDQLDGRRFRHPARFVRWRPDRDARSCTIDQLDAPLPATPAEATAP